MKEVYKKHGVIHKLVKRANLCLCEGNSKVIAVDLVECTYEHQSLVIGYNVEVIRTGINYWTGEPCEVRPSDEQFGSYGWSCINLCSSLKKFDEIVAKYKCCC